MDGTVRQKASFFQITPFVSNFPFIISRFWLLRNYVESITSYKNHSLKCSFKFRNTSIYRK